MTLSAENFLLKVATIGWVVMALGCPLTAICLGFDAATLVLFFGATIEIIALGIIVVWCVFCE
jgi:hypothetical protein